MKKKIIKKIEKTRTKNLVCLEEQKERKKTDHLYMLVWIN